MDIFECKVVLPLRTLYNFGQTIEIRSGALKILLHVLEVCGISVDYVLVLCMLLSCNENLSSYCEIQRHSEKLHHSWTDTLELLR